MNPREREHWPVDQILKQPGMHSKQTVDVRAWTVLLFDPRCLGSGGVLINCSYQLQTQFIVCLKTDYGKAKGFNSTIHRTFDLQIRKLQEHVILAGDLHTSASLTFTKVMWERLDFSIVSYHIHHIQQSKGSREFPW